jgi:hypothetical protein
MALTYATEEVERHYKVGMLKHDLYDLGDYQIPAERYGLFTLDSAAKNISDLKNSFMLAFSAGTVFLCFNRFGVDLWCDNKSLGVDGGNDFAENHRFWGF